MDPQIKADLDEVAVATARLLVTLDGLDDAGILAASKLPNWTRGHVAAHIEGNARGLARLVRQLCDGVNRPMYISYDARNADVAVHAAWPAAAHLGAVEQSAVEFDLDVRAVPADRWVGTVVLGTGTEIPVGRLLPQRLLEVCAHHADLGVASYTWRDWPARVAEFFVPVVAGNFRSRGGFPVDWVEADGTRHSLTDGGATGVRGDGVAVLAWLMGRSSGEGLTPVGLEAVPQAPPWA